MVKLGLTSSQAKIYLTLISLGTADVKKIAQTARVDRGEVYRQLETLLKKALVEKILKVPIEYKPITLKQVLRKLVAQKKRENVEIQQKVKILLEKEALPIMPNEEDSRISILTESMSHLPELYESLQEEEVWYTQIESVPIAINLWSEVFKKAFSRGIRLRTIAELNKPTEAILKLVQRFAKENPNFVIRYVNPTLLTTIAIFDSREMHMYTKKKTGLANRQVLSTTNPVLIAVIKDYFELRWDAAMKEYPAK